MRNILILATILILQALFFGWLMIDESAEGPATLTKIINIYK